MRYIHDLWKFSLWLLTDNKLTGYRLPSTHSNNSISEYWTRYWWISKTFQLSLTNYWWELYVWKNFTIFWQVQLYQSPHADACIHACVKQLLYSVILTRVLLSPTLRKDLHVLLRKKMFWTLARSEEHTSELQSRETISYAVFCLKKKKIKIYINKNMSI